MTASFPREELYGLTSQLRRASTSIGANIAEGCGKDSDREFGRFLGIALGSASELEYLLLLSHDLSLLGTESFETLIGLTVEIKRMLASLAKRLRAEG